MKLSLAVHAHSKMEYLYLSLLEDKEFDVDQAHHFSALPFSAPLCIAPISSTLLNLLQLLFSLLI